MTLQRKFVSGAIVSDSALGERQIRVIASDATVDRAKDVMVPEGVVLSNYKKNPIVLADHNPTTPIGTADVQVRNNRVEALIDFAPKGISIKADEYCGLAKAGILNSVSVGFDPLEQEPIKGGGYRFTKWELMELSVISVPCNPEALVISRSLAQQTEIKADAAEWKVGASRNLPTSDEESWDGPAAEASIFEKAGFDGDSPDTNFARKGFLAYDAANPKLKGSYKLPFAKVTDGRLTATAGGINAAASRLPQTDIPDDVRTKARAVIDHYEEKMKGDKQTEVTARKAVIKGKIVKGLYECSELAYVLYLLGSVHDMASFEAAIEGDGSNVPAMLAQALQETAAALLAMTKEEVAEFLAGRGIEIGDDEDEYILSAPTPMAKAFRQIAKAGRVLSAENQNTLTGAHKLASDAHETMTKCMGDVKSACDMVKGILDKAKKPDDGEGDDGSGDDTGGDDDGENQDDNNELAAQAVVAKAAEDDRARRLREIDLLTPLPV